MRDEFGEPMFFPICQKTSKFKYIEDKTLLKRHKQHNLNVITKGQAFIPVIEPSTIQRTFEFSPNSFESSKIGNDSSDTFCCTGQTLNDFSFDLFGDDDML